MASSNMQHQSIFLAKNLMFHTCSSLWVCYVFPFSNLTSEKKGSVQDLQTSCCTKGSKSKLGHHEIAIMFCVCSQSAHKCICSVCDSSPDPGCEYRSPRWICANSAISNMTNIYHMYFVFSSFFSKGRPACLGRYYQCSLCIQEHKLQELHLAQEAEGGDVCDGHEPLRELIIYSGMWPVPCPDRLHCHFAESYLPEGRGCQRGVQSEGLDDGECQAQPFEYLAVMCKIYNEKKKISPLSIFFTFFFSL